MTWCPCRCCWPPPRNTTTAPREPIDSLPLRHERPASRIAAAARIADDGTAGTADPLEASGRLLAEVADNDGDFALLQAESWLYAVQSPEAMAALAARRQELATAAERLVAAELDRRGTPAPVPLAPSVTTVVLALFDGPRSPDGTVKHLAGARLEDADLATRASTARTCPARSSAALTSPARLLSAHSYLLWHGPNGHTHMLTAEQAVIRALPQIRIDH